MVVVDELVIDDDETANRQNSKNKGQLQVDMLASFRSGRHRTICSIRQFDHKLMVQISATVMRASESEEVESGGSVRSHQDEK